MFNSDIVCVQGDLSCIFFLAIQPISCIICRTIVNICHRKTDRATVLDNILGLYAESDNVGCKIDFDSA